LDIASDNLASVSRIFASSRARETMRSASISARRWFRASVALPTLPAASVRVFVAAIAVSRSYSVSF
jgi:hypothetical protein